METMPWAKGVLYGPAESPRLGETLWVNPLPIYYKLCSFNCLHCRLGESDKITSDVTPYVEDMPPVEKVAALLNRALDERIDFDTLALSGNGEPTLHPEFAKLVKEISRIKQQRFPGKTFTLLSNASGLVREDVMESVKHFDLTIFKLDAGQPSTFHRVNRPDPGVVYEEIVEQLCKVGAKAHLQTVFVAGPRGNLNAEDIKFWMQAIAQIKPKTVEIYSINREFPGKGIEMVPLALLETLARKTEVETGIAVDAFGHWK